MAGGGSRGQAWFCTTGLPSDIVIEVGDMVFHLHKFPLMSKSQKLHYLITDLEKNPPCRPQYDDDDDHRDDISSSGDETTHLHHHIVLPDFPGGPDIFEAAAKFCYGVRLDLTPWNAAPLRCAAEYLLMTSDDDNLASRTDLFLSHSVLSNLSDSIRALKSCEHLMPLADRLGIVRSCLDSIAARSRSAPLLFSWPVGQGNDPPPLHRRRHRRSSSSSSATTAASSSSANGSSWLDDLSVLSLPFFKRVVAAMRAADPTSEALEGSLVSYARRSIPGLSRSGRKHASAPISAEAEQRELLETVVASLPPVAGLATARFLFRLLRTAVILGASEASREALERRIASQLEQAAVDDLLIPSYSYQVETLYDVGCVERVIQYFLESLQQGRVPQEEEEEEVEEQQRGARPPCADRLARVGRLVDGYLAEIASDSNVKAGKFCDLALALPDDARVYDDGLYRAVDVYLKAHPETTEEEREQVCGVMDCRKLTLEACTHAAQNERLPLRVVVQVLFFEQVQLRRAIAGTLMAAGAQEQEEEGQSQQQQGRQGEEDGGINDDGGGGGALSGAGRRSAARVNQVMRLDMDSMRRRVQELEKECSSMRRKIERINRGVAGGELGWTSFTRKMGCRFKTQVCDSHERAVVESRRKSPAEKSP